MTFLEWLVVLVPISFALIGVFADRFKSIKVALDAFVIGAVFSLVFSLYTEKIPEIRTNAGMMYSVARESIVYTTFEKANIVSNKLDRISDLTIKSIFTTQLNREINNLNNVLGQLERDRVTISKNDAMSFGETALDSATKTVDATSYVSPGSWWLSPTGAISRGGRDYIKKNEGAVKRGVRVRRVFIFDSEKEKNDMDLVLSENKNAGVEVLYLYTSQTEGSSRADLLLVDKKLGGELTLDVDTRKFDRFEATISSSAVEDIARRIDAIIRQAEAY